MPHRLGRKPPPDFTHVEKYPHQLRAAIQKCEKNINVSTWIRRYYNQLDTPQCVAFSTGQERSQKYRIEFDAHWLYAECKKRDGYPNEDGTFTRVALDVLREEGFKTKQSKYVQETFGIKRNEWLTSVDEMRQAVVTSPTGILVATNWYMGMFNPTHNGQHYTMDPKNLGQLAGGHQYWIKGVSDNLGGFLTPSTWGQPDRNWQPGEDGWPITLIPYELMDRLMKEDGEAAIIVE